MRRGDTWDLHSSAWRRERWGYSDMWVGEVVLLLLLLLLLVLLLLYSYSYTILLLLLIITHFGF